MSKGLLIVVSGFTGSGKGTVLQKLTEMAPEKYTRCITMTTRTMRPGEQDGIDYIFCSKEEFKRLLDQQKILEWTCYAGNFYGTSKETINTLLKSGKNVLIILNTEGGLYVKKEFPEAVLVFITPPSMAELEKRRVDRGTETEKEYKKRTEEIRKELRDMRAYDYILVNEDAWACAKELDTVAAIEGKNVMAKSKLIKNLEEEYEAEMQIEKEQKDKQKAKCCA